MSSISKRIQKQDNQGQSGKSILNKKTNIIHFWNSIAQCLVYFSILSRNRTNSSEYYFWIVRKVKEYTYCFIIMCNIFNY